MEDKKHVMDSNLNINNKMEKKKIVIVGGGVAGICAATKLVDNDYPGELITVIDMGKDPYNRKPEEVMSGFMGCGLWSDGKLTYHTAIGGQLSKYCGEDKAYNLMDQVIEMVKRFHPNPEAIMYSNPTEEPDFIKPHFGLRLFGVYHIGTDYLHEIGKNWYDYLVSKGVKFVWEEKVFKVDFESNLIYHTLEGKEGQYALDYDKLIFGVGKSGIDFAQQIQDEYHLETEPKSVQIGVRFEAPQEHFQKLIDISYDFKLYRKFDDKGVSLRSFCTNNNAAYVAVEETYGDITYNGHAKKDPKYLNGMTNFGIIMELNGIKDPFEWSRKVVSNVQSKGTGLYYSPSRTVSTTSEGNGVSATQISWLELLEVMDAFEGYFEYIVNFIDDMKKVFPTLGDDWGIYIPEVKYLSPEPLVNYKDLSLNEYSKIHFVGDALSARGITVSGAHGIYVAEAFLDKFGNSKNVPYICEWDNIHGDIFN
jgi:uncharacterized FAD-dependent dehydrogenase